MKKAFRSGLIVLAVVLLLTGSNAVAPRSARDGCTSWVDRQTTANPSSKAQAQPASQQQVVEKRLCDRLKLFQSKLQQIEKSLSGITGAQDEFKTAQLKIKQEGLFPAREINTVSIPPAQNKAGLIPAEKIQAQTQVLGKLTKINGDMKRAKGLLGRQVVDLQSSWKEIGKDLGQVSASSSAPSPARFCASAEAKQVLNQISIVRTQASNLQSQLDDVRDAIDREYGQGPCSSKGCKDLDFWGCCNRQNPLTAAENTAERQQQETAMRRCFAACTTVETSCHARELNSLMA